MWPSVRLIQRREYLDQKIARLKQELIEAQVERNSLSPIAVLPDEIIAKIFLELAFLEDVFTGKALRAMLVCRRWRAIVDQHAQLWSYVSSDRGRFFRAHFHEWIKKSAGFPLSCRLSVSEYTTISCWWVVHQCDHRICYLDLTGTTTMLDKLLSECTDFPTLTALHLSAYRSSDDEDAPEYYALPPALLESGCLSRLRSVFFHNVAFIRWDLLKNLTMLKLNSSNDWDDTSQEVDSHELLALLQRSPQLQYLSLDRSHLPSDPNLLGAAGSSLGSRVQLNALAELKLRGSVYVLNTFLTCIDFPPSTSLSLILAALDHGSVCKAILPRLTPVLNHRNVPPVRMLRFEGALDSYMSVEGHEDERFSHASLLDEGHFRFTTYPSTHATTRRILTKFIHSFSLRSVTHVDFSSIVKVEGQFSRTTFAALFREMLWVKHIRIGVNNAMVAMLYGLIDVLQRNGKGLWGRRRRLLASHGPIRLTHLHLLPGHKGRRISEVHLDDSDEEAALYDELTIFLRSYQDLDIPTKPRGECWNTLDFDQPRTFGAGTFTAGILDPTIRRRVSRLVKTLLIVGHDWSDRGERSYDSASESTEVP